MRIVAGKFRGRPLATPRDDRIRPTTDRVRESLFNIIESRHGCDGARVLDLFSGTGALGLEALSRGAQYAMFIDNHAESRGLIRQNVEAFGLTGHAKILRRDATDLGPMFKGKGEPFDLIFLDPPYGKGLGEAALRSALEGEWIAENALIVFECGANEEPEVAGIEFDDERQFGDTKVLLGKPSG